MQPDLVAGKVDSSSSAQAAALRQMAAGGWVAQALYVAAKLGVADLLAEGARRPDEIAAAAGANPDALHRVLRLLASLGVFVEDEFGRFGLTPLAGPLRSDAPASLGAFVVMLNEGPHWRAWGQLLHTVRTGESAFVHVYGSPIFSYYTRHPVEAQVFDAAITSRARQENESAVAAYSWPDHGTIVDVGGGEGSLLAAILATTPSARGVLFELPHVASAAARFLAQAGLSYRCETISGDFTETIPSGGALYLLRRVLHGCTDERAILVLRNCRAAMAGGARLLVIEQLLEPGNEPSWGKMLDVQMLVLSAGGRERQLANYETILASAGLRVLSVIATAAGPSIIEAAAP